MNIKQRVIPPSELILNEDGTIFHLHLKPCDVCKNVILVGDPSRVDLIGSFFDETRVNVHSREFKTIKGTYKDCEIMVLSTGIGTDNIDIVLNELDALSNIDFTTRKQKDQLLSLNILRIGTTGGVQEHTKLGDLILSKKSIGIDALAWYYKDSETVRDSVLENEFINQTSWGADLPKPYAVSASEDLIKAFSAIATLGITVTAPGFYSAQGRTLRLKASIENMIEKLENFNFNSLKITNIEMESSAVALLSNLLGHKAATICLVVAQRKENDANSSYHGLMEQKIKLILDNFITIK